MNVIMITDCAMRSKEPFRRAYNIQKSNAKSRGIPFEISFEDWRDIWVSSGKWEQRGRRRGNYCMMRYGDAGAYAVGNVLIGLQEDNLSAGNKGRKFTAEHRAKLSAATAGRPRDYARGDRNPMHRPEAKAKISAAISGSKHYHARQTVTPFGTFGSTTEAAKALKIERTTIRRRCNSTEPQWAGWYMAIRAP